MSCLRLCPNGVWECQEIYMASDGDNSRPINDLEIPRASLQFHMHHYFPCAMALRLMPRSPRRRIRIVTVIRELTAELDPAGRLRLRELDISNGCQDHTVLPYADSAVRPARRRSLTETAL